MLTLLKHHQLGVPNTTARALRLRHRRIVSTLESFYIAAATRAGLLLGYGGLSLDEIDRGGAALMDLAARH